MLIPLGISGKDESVEQSVYRQISSMAIGFDFAMSGWNRRLNAQHVAYQVSARENDKRVSERQTPHDEWTTICNGLSYAFTSRWTESDLDKEWDYDEPEAEGHERHSTLERAMQWKTRSERGDQISPPFIQSLTQVLSLLRVLSS
uniref:Uncharacterized protein n=1 Tax=Spongospora subterranea TaxID=70186 RepID=A0A0H5QJ67_9EUKA|eukprot:CRZ01697.1 hypothetical protein [Spongospora subterranea]